MGVQDIFLKTGEDISMIKAKINVMCETINRSYPKTHALNKKIHDLRYYIHDKLCDSLDSDICNYYTIDVKDLNGKSITSVFYSTTEIENPFKNNEYQRKRSYSKQLSVHETKYMNDLLNTIANTLFTIVGDKHIFIRCTDTMVQKILAIGRDIEALIGPKN